LQFERPWDRLVPAKSVRKLTARTVVSKKFLGTDKAYRKGFRVRCPERIILERDTTSGEDSERYTV
jgi:hypothetical protein